MNHVLIVDDDAPVRRLLHRWVDAEGAIAMEADSAEQGLLLASQSPPAVALCDIHLPPGRDGFWLVEQLGRLHATTAVVMTTGSREFDAALTSLRAGVTDYIVKPATRERIQTALRRALDEHKTREALAAFREEPAVMHTEDANARRSAERVSALAVTLAQVISAKDPELSDNGHPTPDLPAVRAVAEAFDALTVGSRPRLTPLRAVETLCGARAREFDPVVLRALKLARSIGTLRTDPPTISM